MAATTAQLPATGEWTLTGVQAEQGGCDCCARRITQRVFHVHHDTYGDMLLGRRCAARATGYAVNRLERAEAGARRGIVMAARRALVLAAYPSVASDLAAYEGGTPAFEIAGIGLVHRVRTAITEDRMWDDVVLNNYGQDYLAG